MTDLTLVGDIHGVTNFETDAELLRRSATEPSVFGGLYRRHGVAVRRYVVRRVGIESGEDLAAEVFARAFRTRGKCRADHGSALPWLLGVANHVIGDHRRLERRRLATLEHMLVEADKHPVERDLGLSPEMLRALRRLSTADRDTLLLLVWGELSRDEVAAALGVPVGTVNSRIARARKRLASDLAPVGPTARSDLSLNGESNG